MKVYIRHTNAVEGVFVDDLTPKEKDKLVNNLREYNGYYEEPVKVEGQRWEITDNEFFWEIIVEDE